jgi:hypothetical protein
MGDQVIFSIGIGGNASSKITVISVKDIHRDVTYLWSRATGWNNNTPPSITVGTGTIQIDAAILNEGDYGRILGVLTRQPDSAWPTGLQLDMFDEYMDGNSNLWLSWTGDMPAAGMSIKVYCGEL